MEIVGLEFTTAPLKGNARKSQGGAAQHPGMERELKVR
jgi:hypothetical protein